MNETEFIKQFADILEYQYDIANLSLDTVFRDLEDWSSLTSVAIQIMVSSDLSSSLSNEELQQAETIRDLYEIISQNINL